MLFQVTDSHFNVYGDMLRKKMRQNVSQWQVILKDPAETEKRYEIVFSIFKDGSVVTDSNYLPDDVNALAHKSMDDLQKLFGNDRVMTKKPEYDIFMRNS